MKRIFTDSIKDVIGNDPVLDQFDISYQASFYGTTPDDYVTGSIIEKIKISNSSLLITGSRGRAISKLYSKFEVVPDPVDGSPDPSWGPKLSSYLQPWTEKTGNSYRFTNLYDETERFYDSCLPNLQTCLEHDGTKLKTIVSNIAWENDAGTVTANLDLDPTAKDITLNPDSNFESKKTAFVVFNAIKATGSYGDPSVNNEWTWSFPYENKFLPEKRFLQQSDSLATTISSKALPGLPTAATNAESFGLPISTQIDTLFPILTGSPVSMFWGGPPSTIGLPLLTYASSKQEPAKADNIVPILPGHIPETFLPSGGRNGNRTLYPYEQNSYFMPISETSDSKYGFSFLVPSDVNLENSTTGSAQKNDLIKFLFGFGDVNTVSYIDQKINQQIFSTPYEKFFGNSDDTPRSFGVVLGDPSLGNAAIGPYPNINVDDSLTVSWSENSFNVMNRTWVFSSPQHVPLVGPPPLHCYAVIPGYVSGTNGSTVWPGSIGYWTWNPPAGYGKNVRWNFNATLEINANNKCLMVGYCPAGEKNILLMSVTSSYPWNYSYTRIVHSSHLDNTLKSFVVRRGVNGYTDVFDNYYEPTDFINEQISIGNIDPKQYYTNLFDLYGYSDPNDIATGSPAYTLFPTSSIDPVADSYTSTMFPPGTWLVGFVYSNAFSPQSNQDFAVISDVKINQFKESSIITENGSRIGGNNYPQFREIKYRELPENSDGKDRSRNYKSSLFGVSPIIRGWKYGLSSGLPAHSRVVFRRDRFGQFRDMLEQRPYTKFVVDSATPFGNVATPGDKITVDGVERKQNGGKVNTKNPGEVGDAAVQVKFVKQYFSGSANGIGIIATTDVDPASTISSNLSPEVTSSLPYFDGIVRNT